MAEEGGAPQSAPVSPILEKIIVIGYGADGTLGLVYDPGLNPASVVIILEQLRQEMIGQFRFKRERKINIVPGAVLGALNGKRN